VYRLQTAGTVRLGRDRRVNDIEIEDTSVSRHHAVLHIGSKLRIEDKSSRNGTEVYQPGKYSETDTTIHHRPQSNCSFDVEVGDRIKLGSVILVVRKAMFEPEKGTSGPRMWTSAPTVSDPLMEALYEDVREAAQTSMRLSILIFGETGAGKESVAREIHDASPRKSRPFIAVNCTQFTDTLVESALFGYVKNAFSGAKTDKPGFFHVADTGTLFLDEIADLPIETQAKLLRVFEFGEVYRVGATKPEYVNVRVVAATNKNLLDCVRRGTFREDLYYRLRGFEFEVPPLRKRPKDIIALADRFLADACGRDNHPNLLRFSDTAIACLRNYAFPGNVRELKNAVEVASVRCRGAMILPEHFPAEISKLSMALPEPESTPNAIHSPIGSTPPIGEKARLLEALHAHGFNQKRAAQALGISNRTLVNWLNRYPDIRRPKKKHEEARHLVDLPPTTPNSSGGSHAYDRWPNGDF
jgi:two-component system, NtrC family, response regulator AtoC